MWMDYRCRLGLLCNLSTTSDNRWGGRLSYSFFHLDFFFPLCPLYLFPYSLISSCLLILSLYLISFLLFPCASVWENFLAWVPQFLLAGYCYDEWYSLFFRQCNYRCTMCMRSEKGKILNSEPYTKLMFINIVFWLGSDKSSGLLVSFQLYFVQYWRLSFCHLLLFLCLISFLLFSYGSLWGNNCAWVPHCL